MGGENSLLNSFDGSMREHLVQKVQCTPGNHPPQHGLYVSLRTHLLVYSFPVESDRSPFSLNVKAWYARSGRRSGLCILYSWLVLDGWMFTPNHRTNSSSTLPCNCPSYFERCYLPPPQKTLTHHACKTVVAPWCSRGGRRPGTGSSGCLRIAIGKCLRHALRKRLRYG